MSYFIIGMSQRLSLPNQIKRWKRLWTEQQVEIARLKGLLEEIENEQPGIRDITHLSGASATVTCKRCLVMQTIAARAR